MARCRLGIISVIFTLLFIGSLASRSYSLETMVGYPGSTWGTITHDVDTISGSGLMFNVNQGVDWIKFAGDVYLNTYVEYRYRYREFNQTYYNAHGPAIGVELRKSIFAVGYDYYWETFPKLGITSLGKEVYATMYDDWDFGGDNDDDTFIGTPGSIWIRLSHDAEGLNGSGIMGFANQGVDWFKRGIFTFNTYAEYRYRWREKNQLYYNAQGPAVGAEVHWSYFHLGVNYYWETLPVLKETSNRAILYFSWYYNWDLKD